MCKAYVGAACDNVLDISKVEAGKKWCLKSRLLVLMTSLNPWWTCLLPSLGVVLGLSDNIPAFVKGDSSRIRQIFSNLLSYSLKFTTHGYVLVRGWVDQSLLEPSVKRATSVLTCCLEGRDPLLMSAENQLALVFEVDDSGG